MNNLYIVTRYTPDGFLAGTIPTQWMYELQRILAVDAKLLDMIRWDGGILKLGDYIELYWHPIFPEARQVLVDRISSIPNVPVHCYSMGKLEVIKIHTRAFFGQKHKWLKEVVNPGITPKDVKAFKSEWQEFNELYQHSPLFSDKELPSAKLILTQDANAEAFKNDLLEKIKHDLEQVLKDGHQDLILNGDKSYPATVKDGYINGALYGVQQDLDAEKDKKFKEALEKAQKIADDLDEQNGYKSKGLHGGSNLSALGGSINYGKLSSALDKPPKPKGQFFPWNTQMQSIWNAPITSGPVGLTKDEYLIKRYEPDQHTNPVSSPDDSASGESARAGGCAAASAGEHSGGGTDDDDAGQGDEPAL